VIIIINISMVCNRSVSRKMTVYVIADRPSQTCCGSMWLELEGEVNNVWGFTFIVACALKHEGCISVCAL
jgi:hypothetical protein